MSEYPVVIAGAGPVGLTLAIDLAQRGVRSLLVERNVDHLRWPKMERCNARTMEIFRRLGLSETVRAASKFIDVPMDVFAVTDLKAPPLAHIRFPSVREAQALTLRCTDGSMPREPYQLISQYTLEPLLRKVAAALPEIEVRYGCALTSYTQDDDRVTVHLANGDDSERTVTGDYLVGTDGGGSTVRKQLGVRFEGEGNLLRLRQILFRSERLFDAIPIGRGRHYIWPHVGMVVQDDLKHFSMHIASWNADEDAATIVQGILDLKDIDIDVQQDNEWVQNLLLVDQYAKGRVFLAGDAAHIVIPNAGLGLNTGIGDATDLAWKLAGAVQGWGGPRLLESYHDERRPIGIRNREASGRSARNLVAWRALCDPATLNDRSPVGLVRRRLVEREVQQRQQHAQGMDGVELGYRYLGSPIIVEEPGSGPELNDVIYTPTTSPGARLPHMWLEDRSALLDHMTLGYNLIQLAGEPGETAALEAAMAQIGAPFAVHLFRQPHLLRVYERRFLLLRPDLHIVWRGDAMPGDPQAVAKRVTGHEVVRQRSLAGASGQATQSEMAGAGR